MLYRLYKLLPAVQISGSGTSNYWRIQRRRYNGRCQNPCASFVCCTVFVYLLQCTADKEALVSSVFIKTVSFVCTYKMVQSSMGVASISQQFLNIGPEIFLALVLWNGEWERFHTLHTGGTDPCQQNNIRIF